MVVEEISQNIIISVCIATYKREALLENLLQSLVSQVLPDNIILEIIITDNNALASAQQVVKRFKSNHKIIFKYFIQPQKNISLTRNVCVENSSGDYICFIDDDETADKNWISDLFNCVHRFNADGAFGFVTPIFDPHIKNYFKQRELYFSPVERSGEKAKYYYTTNCIVKAPLIKTENVPFDPNYGLTGGEDVKLFDRLFDKGAKFICCREAKTYEYIPKERGTYKYLFNRALRGGQSYLRRNLEYKNNLFYKMRVSVKVILRFLLGIFLFSLYPFSKKIFVLGIISIGDAVGKLRALLLQLKNIY